MAALLLARTVVTMMPTPVAVSARAVARAVDRVPRYLDLMESWGWSMPLWNAGVIAPVFEGSDAAEDVRAAACRIGDDDAYSDLRPFMNQRLFESEHAWIDLVARDVLKGGPDPGVCVPVAAGMDAFASRHALWVARATPTSMAQKAEALLSDRLALVAAPILMQATSEALLEARAALEDEISDLTSALEIAARGGGEGKALLQEAARAYTTRFHESFEAIARVPSDEDIRIVAGTVTISVERLPADAVLRSSLDAARAASGRRVNGKREEASGALARASERPSVLAMVVKPLGRASAR